MKKVNTSSETIRECDVFISYRRDGGDMTAMYFYQALKDRGYNVFYDLEVLRAGKFNEALLDSIKSCTDFVVILSPHALDRCNDENDWVRREIAEALRSKKNIIPVMLKGFTFPETLPEEIDDIRYQNGLSCTTEYFEESINRLCQRYLRSLPISAKKKNSPIIPILAVLAVLAVGVGAFLATRGRPAAPAPEPTAAIEITAEPTATPTPEPTPTPTPEPTPTPTPEPTEEPGPLVVRDTDFPVLTRAFEVFDGDDGDIRDAVMHIFENATLPGNASIRRRNVRSVTFLPSLEDAPEDAWDISEAGDGRVLAWAVPQEKLYDLYIAGEGGVKLVDPDEGSRLFIGFTAMERFSLNGCVDLSERTDLSLMFCGDYALEEVDLTGICTGRATSMWGMFNCCRKLKEIDLSGFDTARVNNISDMFQACESLTALDITGLDTSRVIEAGAMFSGCSSLKSLDVSQMDTSRMTTMDWMFDRCSSLDSLDVSHFDTGRVTNMYQMFYECTNLETLDVSGFDTSRVKTMEEMFCGCESLKALDVSGFDTSRVENMRGMFAKCKNVLTLDVSGFNTSRVTQMDYMFDDCPLLDGLDLSGWDTSQVTNMKAMLSACSSLYRLDLSGWDTLKVTSMSEMFTGDSSLTEVLLTGWDVSSVTDMRIMFRDCENLESIGRDPSEFGHGNTAGMFDNCPRLNVKPS